VKKVRIFRALAYLNIILIHSMITEIKSATVGFCVLAWIDLVEVG